MFYLSPAKAAARLGVSTKTLERWLAKGKIQAIYTVGGHKRYDLDSFVPPANKRELPDAHRLAMSVG
jgi:excisionase family DNA binding protein